MKELSIEEKAKAYDKAIERARVWKEKSGMPADRQGILDDIFPELKVSEDEEVRKALYEYFKKLKDDGDIDETWYGFSYDKILAWLEKKGEQKPTDKVKPTFKIGDWVIDKQGIVHQTANVVENVTNHTYGYDIVGSGYFNDNTEGVRLWTIQDAKDGDVISFNDGHGNDCIELIKSITNKKIEFWFCLTNGNSYEVFDGIIPYTNLASRKGAILATQEQRDTLFAKIKEAGYEWDAEKKELKKINSYCKNHCKGYQETGKCFVDGGCKTKRDAEQNPAWSEEELVQEKKDAYNEALDKIEYNSGNPTFDDGWSAAIWYIKKRNSKFQTVWKPSDEQLKGIECAIKTLQHQLNVGDKRLNSLYNDLKKLREK